LFLVYFCIFPHIALHKLQNSENIKVKNAVGGALWQIEGKNKHKQNTVSEELTRNGKYLLLKFLNTFVNTH